MKYTMRKISYLAVILVNLSFYKAFAAVPGLRQSYAGMTIRTADGESALDGQKGRDGASIGSYNQDLRYDVPMSTDSREVDRDVRGASLERGRRHSMGSLRDDAFRQDSFPGDLRGTSDFTREYTPDFSGGINQNNRDWRSVGSENRPSVRSRRPSQAQSRPGRAGQIGVGNTGDVRQIWTGARITRGSDGRTIQF